MVAWLVELLVERVRARSAGLDGGEVRMIHLLVLLARLLLASLVGDRYGLGRAVGMAPVGGP